ncbi:YceI family protein [Streptomyces sp. NPDC001508]|uniref:YceI family protein n=1 Tax=Streptomyces sp. NPDC001508 TaxID=3154656 RepID=UPI0033313D84
MDPNRTAIRFVARHLGPAEIHGRFDRCSGGLGIAERMRDSWIGVPVEADGIDTGICMRDDHRRPPDRPRRRHPYPSFGDGDFVHRGAMLAGEWGAHAHTR